MSCFHVGQVVVCVNGGNWSPDYLLLRRPRAGGVYTIREVYLGAGNAPSVLLNEISNETRQHLTIDGLGRTEPGFRAARFRPAEPTSIALFTQALRARSSEDERVP
jgi:hypothetical protein